MSDCPRPDERRINSKLQIPTRRRALHAPILELRTSSLIRISNFVLRISLLICVNLCPICGYSLSAGQPHPNSYTSLLHQGAPMPEQQPRKIVLAYSGGLDTSVILP